MSSPVISVLMLAYNHGEYIRQAIESVVSQTSSPVFELLIGEDGSSDNTRQICLELQAEFPQCIRVITSDHNQGMHKNFARLWQEAAGAYVAFCEGDDYWLDAQKLHKQFEFLSDNADCSLCGTLATTVLENDNGQWYSAALVKPPLLKNKYSFEELISSYNFHFSSVMLKKTAVHFPSWFQTVYCVDRPLYLLAAMHGKAGLIAEATSAYRIHEKGHWSSISMSGKAASSIDLFCKMVDYFDPRYRKLFLDTLSDILWDYMSRSLDDGQLTSAKVIYWQSIRYASLSKTLTHLGLFSRVFLRLHFPSCYNLGRTLARR